MLTLEQESSVCRLYKARTHTIKEIMSATGVKSEQTIYRILDENEIPRRPSRKIVTRRSIGFDAKTMFLIKKHNPDNLSEWICKMIQKGCQ